MGESLPAKRWELNAALQIMSRSIMTKSKRAPASRVAVGAIAQSIIARARNEDWIVLHLRSS